MIEFHDHFSDEAWVDFVRGVVLPEKTELMEQHLTSGCHECQSRYSLWNLVAQTAGREPEYEPPETVVRSVEDAYITKRQSSFPMGAPVVAQLVSAVQGLPAGVRGGTAPRRYLYEVTDFVVDLGVSVRSDRAACVITGHVAARKGAASATAGTRVFLVGLHNRVVQQVIADEVGGFQLEAEDHDDFNVLLDVPGGTIIEVFLPKGDPS